MVRRWRRRKLKPEIQYGKFRRAAPVAEINFEVEQSSPQKLYGQLSGREIMDGRRRKSRGHRRFGTRRRWVVRISAPFIEFMPLYRPRAPATFQIALLNPLPKLIDLGDQIVQFHLRTNI